MWCASSRTLEGATCGTQRQARCRRRAPRRRGEGFRGEAPWLQFTNSIDAALDLPMHEKNASVEVCGAASRAADEARRLPPRPATPPCQKALLGAAGGVESNADENKDYGEHHDSSDRLHS